jgi:DUF4097 and DUF4098 domain-containing protein YvlB
MTGRNNSIHLKSISGKIDVALDGRLKADVSLKSAMGQVSTNFDLLKTDGKEMLKGQREVKGKLNGGGELIQLETVVGNVNLISTQ